MIDPPPSSVAPNSLAARLPAACFVIASLTAVIGVSLGVYMGIGRDHTLAPVHVHLNLIGWVSLFLCGLFYKTHPSAIGKTAVVQVAMLIVGYVAMLSGLAYYLLTGNEAVMPLAIVGSLLVWLGILLFFLIVARAR
jgi:hypothetical protein